MTLEDARTIWLMLTFGFLGATLVQILSLWVKDAQAVRRARQEAFEEQRLIYERLD